MSVADTGASIWAQLTERSKASLTQTGSSHFAVSHHQPESLPVIAYRISYLSQVAQTPTCMSLVLEDQAKALC